MAFKGRVWVDGESPMRRTGQHKLSVIVQGVTGTLYVQLAGAPFEDVETLRIWLTAGSDPASVLLYDGPLAGNELVQVVQALQKGGD
jgi:hypothetical protein